MAADVAVFTRTDTAERLLATLAPTGSSAAAAVAGGAAWVVRPGVEVHAPGALDVKVPWSLPAGEIAGTGPARAGGTSLVLRAAGNLTLLGSVNAGFEAPFGDTGADARSWTPTAGAAGSIRMVAGADLTAADVSATLRPGALAAEAGTLAIGTADTAGTPTIVRSTTGRIGLHAARDLVLSGPLSAVYTTGRPVETPPPDAPSLEFSPLAFEFVPAANELGYISPFLQGGGSVSLNAGGSVVGVAPDPIAPYLLTDWWWRGVNAPSALWWSRYDRFSGGVATFGGGDVTVRAGQDVKNLNAASATNGWIPLAGGDNTAAQIYGGGALDVTAGRDLLGGSLFGGGSMLSATAGSRIGADLSAAGSETLAPEVVYQGTEVSLQARGELTLSRLRSAGQTAPSLANASGSIVLGGLDADASLRLNSTAGSVTSLALGQINSAAELRDGSWAQLGNSLPGVAQIAAPQGSVTLGSSTVQQPGAAGRLQVLAAADLQVGNVSVLAGSAGKTPQADAAITVVEQQALAGSSVAAGDGRQLDGSSREPVLLAARDGDLVLAGNLQSARPLQLTAGRDLIFEAQGNIFVQHQPHRLDGQQPVAVSEMSLLQAGRDISAARSGGGLNGITIAGPGDLVLLAGRDIDLGATAGVNAIGNQRNGTLLPEGGANLTLAAGVRLDGSDIRSAVAGGYGATGATELLNRPGSLYLWLKDGNDAVDDPAASVFDKLSSAEQLQQITALLGDGYTQALASYLRLTLALGMTPAKAQAFIDAGTPALLANPITAGDVQRVQSATPADRPAVALALLRETRVRERIELSGWLRAVLARDINSSNAQATLDSSTDPLRESAVGALLFNAFAARPAASRMGFVTSQLQQLTDSYEKRLTDYLKPVLEGPLQADAAYTQRIAVRLKLPEATAPAEVLRTLGALPVGKQLAALDASDQAPWLGHPDQVWLARAADLSAYLARTVKVQATPADAAAALAAQPLERQLPWLNKLLRQDLQVAGTASAQLAGEAFDAANVLGYLSLDALFPISNRGDGSRFDSGDILMPTSQVRTSQAASITLLAPTGGINAGEVVPGAVVKKANELGVVTVSGGDIVATVRDNFEVNQSRVFTLGQGDILLWASDGNVDAGRGAKTVSGAPAPVLRLDANGNLVLDTSGSFSGSGIATLDAGSSVLLFAPRGEVNAGEAGISSAGNLTIAAAALRGADNIAVVGSNTGGTQGQIGGTTASLAGLGQSATNAANAAPTNEEDDDRKKRTRRRNVFLDFLGFGAGD